MVGLFCQSVFADVRNGPLRARRPVVIHMRMAAATAPETMGLRLKRAGANA